MFRSSLSEKEVARVKSAARKVGFPWRPIVTFEFPAIRRPIVTRPRAARKFYRRVEAELAQSRVAAAW